MSPHNDVPEQHIPAWKKLGLKLKYAQEKSDSISPNQFEVVNEKKRKRSPLDKDTSSPDGLIKILKKNKTKVEALRPTSDDSNSNTFQPSQGELTSTPPPDQETPTRPGVARKSVSFTPDTKKTDGDSVKQLYQTWLHSHEAKDSSFNPSAFIPDSQVITPHTTSSPTLMTQQMTTMKKTKKAKGSKGPKKASQQSNGQRGEEPSPSSHQATLKYLHTYHTNRSMWKFSKNRQSHLLRRLFFPGFIPSSYYLALQAYLSGLQGESAKNLLRRAARKIQVEDLHVSQNQDLDKAGAHSAKEDSTGEKQSHTTRDLETKDGEKKEEEEEGEGDVLPKPDLKSTIPRKQIADLVLQIIGNDGNNDNDSDNDVSNDNEVKEQVKEGKKQLNSESNQKPKSTTTNTNIKLSNNQNKHPETNNNITHIHLHPLPQPYKKRIRKHKARVEPPDDDDDDDDESSSRSSSDSSNGS